MECSIGEVGGEPISPTFSILSGELMNIRSYINRCIKLMCSEVYVLYWIEFGHKVGVNFRGNRLDRNKPDISG